MDQLEQNKFEYSKSSDPEKYSKELEIAVRSVHVACLVCEKVQESLVSNSNAQVQTNEDSSSPAIIAAYSVQATISMILSEAFGTQNIPIFSEESTQTLSKDNSDAVLKIVNACLSESPRFGLKTPIATNLESIKNSNSNLDQNGRFWVLNPIDNVLGFVRGDQYAVTLALMEEGEVVVGVIGCPNYPLKKELLSYQNSYRAIISKLISPNIFPCLDKGCVIYTQRCSGNVWSQPLIRGGERLVWPNFAKKLRVSNIDNMGLATFCEPVEKPNANHSFTAGLAHSVGLRNQPVPLRIHNTLKYVAIACGDAEVFMKFKRAGQKEKIRDHAAGVLIIQEAGGIVSDIGGNPLDFSDGTYLERIDRGILACAGPKLHANIIADIDASWNSSCL